MFKILHNTTASDICKEIQNCEKDFKCSTINDLTKRIIQWTFWGGGKATISPADNNFFYKDIVSSKYKAEILAAVRALGFRIVADMKDFDEVSYATLPKYRILGFDFGKKEVKTITKVNKVFYTVSACCGEETAVAEDANET